MPSSPFAVCRSRAGLLLTSSALVLSLAACGSDGDSTETASGGENTHSVEHARGTTEVPEQAKRVVVLEPVQLDTAIALGVTPVGSAVVSEEAGIPAYLGEAGDEIEQVGTTTEPSLELIAKQKPDLIIGTESRHSDLYEQLNDIAPTVFMESQTEPWRDNVAFVGNALNIADEATGILDDYDARCAEIKEEHAVTGTAQLVRPRDEAVLSIYGPLSFAASTLECVGFTIPEKAWNNDISIDISPERIAEAKADQVFVTSDDPSDASTLPTAMASNTEMFPSPHLVAFGHWISGVGPVGGMAVLDDIDRILTEAR